jgi:gamma-glutamyltranspeptidase
MGHTVNMRGGSGTVAAIQKTASGYVGVIDPRSAGSASGY